MKTFADAEARLAEVLPGYESREPQQRLARSIEAAMADGNHLLAEAGTGTGKSLGYLIPAILSDKRVVVSTATKALQDQLANKDLPFLEEHLGVNFSWAILKGRSNYLCAQARVDVSDLDAGVADEVTRVLDAHADDEFFLAERDDFAIDDKSWSKLTVTSENCLGSQCPMLSQCFAARAKTAARDADVVVVNHALFFTDLMVRENSDGCASMLGDYDVAVFDEAHEMQEYASSVFGGEFRVSGVNRLIVEVRNYARKIRSEKTVTKQIDALAAAADALFDVLPVGRLLDDWFVCPSGEPTENGALAVEFGVSLRDLSQAMASDEFLVASNNLGSKTRLQTLSNRVGSMFGRFMDLLTDPNLVRWVEEQRSSNPRFPTVKVLRTAPIDVSEVLRPALFSVPDKTSILVSATLAAGSGSDNFAFIARQLGVDSFDSIDVGTPFDYPSQAMLYVPKDMPDPSPRNREAWQNLVSTEILDLVRASKGRALLLFTSMSVMNRVYDSIAHRIDHTVLRQGDASNKELAQSFMNDQSSVLFATRSFFTGVDFQGDACSLVVIDKLPFPVPTDALIEARCARIDASGGNSFSEFVIPSMILPLKQGFGRLIRTRSDRGVVAILDSRLLSKGYGSKIIRSLPDAILAKEFRQVEDFLASV